MNAAKPPVATGKRVRQVVLKKAPAKAAAARKAPAKVAAAPKLSAGPGTLDSNRRKARYGVSYLRSVCSQAGVGVMETGVDEDVLAIDCVLTFPEGQVVVQVKCTSGKTISGKRAAVSLKPEWCEKWAKQKGPVYLLLVIVPADVEVWLTHHPKGTAHASAAFWVRVHGDEGTSVTVPKAQRLTSATFDIWNAEMLAAYGDTA